MASVQDRLKLKRESCDTWSTREQLCLASSVLKSGDQNWISVSRSLRPFAEKEALRPPDWFSQKSCAIQYAILLEKADTPKRKKRESGETTGESIVRRLTQERITELGQILAFQRDEYQQLKNEVNLLKSGNISDEKLKKMWEAIEQEERDAEQKARAHSAWLAKRQQKNETPASQTTPPTPRKSAEPPPETQELQELLPESEEDKKSRGGRSPLLTSLLKSPSPTTQIQNPPSTAQTTSPTIASLLGASPKAQSPQKPTTAPPQFHHVVTSLLTPSVPERPSAGAPTLSMLLELPSNLSRSSLTNLQTAQNQSPLKEPRDLKPKASNRVSSPIANPITNIPGNESMVQIIDHIDDVIGKDKMPEVIDKDEINEIIGDIEELIKEEITKSPKGSEAGGIIEVLGPGGEGKAVGDADEGVSSSSMQEEMAIDEIDQSTSSIAEIIGTAVEPELKAVDEMVHAEGGEVEEEVDKDKREEKEEGEEAKEEEEEEGSMSVGEKDENVELKKEDDDQQEKEEEREEGEEEENKNDMEEDAVEEKTVPEEIPEAPKPEIESPEPETARSDCKNEKEEAELQKEEVEAAIETEEKEVEEKAEPDFDKEDEESEEKTIEIIVPEETTEFKVVLEVKSEDSSTFEEEKPEVKDESVPETEEKTEDPDPEEDPAELLPKPEDKESEDEKPEVDQEVFHEANDKFEENEDTPPKTEELPQSPRMKEEEPSAEPEDIKTDQVPEIPDELKEEAKTPENSDEKMEELEEEPKKFEDNSPKDDLEEDIDPPVLPNELEDAEAVEKKEDNEEMKPQVQVKEAEEESEAKPEPADHVAMEEEPVDEKSEVEPIPEATELPKQEKEDKEVKNEDVEMKKEEIPVSAPEDPEVEEEESSLTKLPARAMKTYSKKQNAVVDSEPETESDADYKAWRKSILLHYSRLATHKYASLFLRPITEDHAPGYHSVVFRPMDLSTIKKNIDNGTIRTNMQFQRDVMLMFQNAIMYNKSDSFVYKMAVSMQEECLQSMQILVEATGEGAYRRDTRTAASSSSETSESSIIKRKRSHITPSPMILDNESPRMKKRRRSEND